MTRALAAFRPRPSRDQRLAVILALPEAEGREAQAEHLAMATTLPVRAVRAELARLPRLDPHTILEVEVQALAMLEATTGLRSPLLGVLRALERGLGT